MDCRVSFEWADGKHEFALGLAQIEELQEKTDCGPFVLFNRLRSTDWRVQDIRETIRLGLVGAGMAPRDALVLIARYVDGKPLLPNVVPAMQIVSAAIFGVADDQPGKARRGRKRRSPLAETESSASPPSTPREP